MNIIRSVPPKVPTNTYVAVDSEWFGLNKATIHRPTTGKFACLTVCFKEDEVYLITDPKNIAPTLEAIHEGVWIIHHAIFDITHLRRHTSIPSRKRIVDTMIMERILWGGYYNFFGLDSLCRRYLHIKLEKDIREEFETATELSPELINYSVNDTNILLKVWNKQKTHITKADMKVWKEADRPAMWAVLDFQGFRVDVSKWEELAVINKKRQEDIDATLPFNPRSVHKTSGEVLPALRKAGYQRIPNTSANTLKKYITKYPNVEATKLAKKILESRKYGKRASTYGQKFIDQHAELEGGYDRPIYSIHANYSITGADTGRMACSAPNMQNIPARDTSEFREKFIARPGNKIIVADYSQQEMGIAAYISGDKNLINIFNGEGDAYIEMAKMVYNETIDKDDPRRQEMKAIALGINYGLTPYGLAEREDMPEDRAEEIISAVLNKFKTLGTWIERQSKEKKCTYTVIGRKGWLNPYSNKCARNALNNPIQGTAGDMLKKAMGKMHDAWFFPYPFGLVAAVHDELVADVPEEIAEDVAGFMEHHMVEVANDMCPGMKFKATALIGDSWSVK